MPAVENKIRLDGGSCFLLLAFFPLFAGLAAGNDEYVRVFLRCSGLSSAGHLAPHRLWSARTASLASFAAAVWMIYRIHGAAADSRPDAHVARTSCFSEIHELVFFIGNFADACPAILGNFTDFARWHLDIGISVSIRDNLCEYSRTAADLSAAARLELDIVDECSDRNRTERKTIASSQWGFFGNDERIADFGSLREHDIATIAVIIGNEADESAAVRIVFDALDLGRDLALVIEEIDFAEQALCAASLVASRDAACMIASHSALASADERLERLVLGQFAAVGHNGHGSA